MFNFDFETYKLISWKRFVIYTLMAVLLGWVLLTLFPILFGWLAGAVLGPLASFFAAHATVYAITQTLLLGMYTLLTVAGLDLIFLFLFYTLLGKIVVQQATWKRVKISLNALWVLLGWQFIVGLIVCIGLCWKEDFSVLWLVPPFLTDSILGSVYMMLWEISLVAFAVGFTFSESWLESLKNGWKMLLYYMPLWMIVGSLNVLLTWLPALLVGQNTPSWVLALWGLFNHTLLFMLVLLFLFNQLEMAQDSETSAN